MDKGKRVALLCWGCHEKWDRFIAAIKSMARRAAAASAESHPQAIDEDVEDAA